MKLRDLEDSGRKFQKEIKIHGRIGERQYAKRKMLNIFQKSRKNKSLDWGGTSNPKENK